MEVSEILITTYLVVAVFFFVGLVVLIKDKKNKPAPEVTVFLARVLLSLFWLPVVLVILYRKISR